MNVIDDEHHELSVVDHDIAVRTMHRAELGGPHISMPSFWSTPT